MISFLSGILEHTDKNRIIIDVSGIGYEVGVSSAMAATLPKTGQKIKVHTYLKVSQDAMQLFGFNSKEEKNLFMYLISVSGVGPKAAMSLLSAFELNKLVGAITRSDIDLLSSAQGIGKKTAQRIVVELKEKLGKAYSIEAGDTGFSIVEEDPMIKDAVSALIALGYQAREARQAVFNCGVDLKSGPQIEHVIKQSLKNLS